MGLRKSRWYQPVHTAAASILLLSCVIVWSSPAPISHESSAHAVVGLLTFLALCVQSALGWLRVVHEWCTQTHSRSIDHSGRERSDSTLSLTSLPLDQQLRCAAPCPALCARATYGWLLKSALFITFMLGIASGTGICVSSHADCFPHFAVGGALYAGAVLLLAHHMQLLTLVGGLSWAVFEYGGWAVGGVLTVLSQRSLWSRDDWSYRELKDTAIGLVVSACAAVGLLLLWVERARMQHWQWQWAGEISSASTISLSHHHSLANGTARPARNSTARALNGTSTTPPPPPVSLMPQFPSAVMLLALGYALTARVHESDFAANVLHAFALVCIVAALLRLMEPFYPQLTIALAFAVQTAGVLFVGCNRGTLYRVAQLKDLHANVYVMLLVALAAVCFVFQLFWFHLLLRYGTDDPVVAGARHLYAEAATEDPPLDLVDPRESPDSSGHSEHAATNANNATPAVALSRLNKPAADSDAKERDETALELDT